MRRRDFLFGAAGATGALGLLFGTGAFSSTQAEREVTVEVVGDDEAYVQLMDNTNGSDNDVISPEIEVSEGDSIHTDAIEIGNRFAVPIEVKLSEASGIVSFHSGGNGNSKEIEGGGLKPVDVDVDVDEAKHRGTERGGMVTVNDIDFEITVENVDDGSVLATVTRSLDVEIEKSTVETVEVNGGTNTDVQGQGPPIDDNESEGGGPGSGGGTIRVHVDGPATHLEADVWNDELDHTSTRLKPGSNPVNHIDTDFDQPAVAVRFPELDQLFIRDEYEFDPEECEFGGIQGRSTVEPTENGDFLECVGKD